MQDDLAKLVREYRPTMTLEIVHSWAVDAKAALETLTRERDEARAEVERWKEAYRKEFLSAIDWAGKTQEMEHERDDALEEVGRFRTQLTATKARLAEAVNILRASVWTEPTFHYQRHWFQRGRDFCAEYDAQQEGQSNG